jgi:uncharacterized protein (TIGR02265 family)
MQTPTIRGIFVNSHVDAVRKAKGEEGARLLEERFGRSTKFGMMEPVSVLDEVRIIDLALDILHDKPIPEDQRDYEAGRLHFRNFSLTPLGEFLLSFFKDDFKSVMLRAPSIANHIFNGITFFSRELGPSVVAVTMSNSGYPPEHFRGLFSEWMHYSGYQGRVELTRLEHGDLEYTMRWL